VSLPWRRCSRKPHNHAEERVQVGGIRLRREARSHHEPDEAGGENLRYHGSLGGRPPPDRRERAERSNQERDERDQSEDAELGADLDEGVVRRRPLEVPAILPLLASFRRQHAFRDREHTDPDSKGGIGHHVFDAPLPYLQPARLGFPTPVVIRGRIQDRLNACEVAVARQGDEQHRKQRHRADPLRRGNAAKSRQQVARHRQKR